MTSSTAALATGIPSPGTAHLDTAVTGPDVQVTLRVMRGRLDDSEIAALAAVLTFLSNGATAVPGPRSTWAAPAWAVGYPLRHGAGGWRTSSLPR